jgi:hypothetical protein
MEKKLIQSSPWPTDLEDLVSKCRYRAHEGWTVRLASDLPRDQATDENGVVTGEVIGHGATLVITTKGYDSYHPERGWNYRTQHFFIVPAATYNRDAWCRWLFDQFVKVETHEAMEHFVIRHRTPDGQTSVGTEDGQQNFWDERPFAPTHGPGCDPYVVHERTTDRQLRTRFTGEVVEVG